MSKAKSEDDLIVGKNNNKSDSDIGINVLCLAC